MSNSADPRRKVLFGTPTWKTLLGCVLISATAFFIYWPSVRGPFVGDDRLYLTNNPLLDEPARLWKAWFCPGSFIEYYPIEQTVQYFQWESWKENPFGYHITNIILHITSSLFVWRLLAKFNLRFAWLGGLLFAVHPMQAESVISIAELKNTLSLPPFLLSMCFWIDYSEKKDRTNYYLALGFFFIAMLCKISMAPFPVVLLLYGWWKAGQITWDKIRESIPFFVLSGILGLLTLLSGHWYLTHVGTAFVEDVTIGPPLSKLALVGTTIAFYFGRFILPIYPLPFYPLWRVNPPEWWQTCPWMLFLIVVFCLWMKRKTWGRHGILGLGFFLLFLAPFAGFFSASFMQFSWVMDHLLYISMIGLIGLLVAVLDYLHDRLPANLRLWLMTGVGLLSTLLIIECYWYVGISSNEEQLVAYISRNNPKAWIAREQFGQYLLEHNRGSEAIEQLDQSLQIEPAEPASHYLLALALEQQARVPEAEVQYKEAIRLRPDLAAFYDGYGQMLIKTGRTSNAIGYIRKALELEPDDAKAHNNLASALVAQGDLTQAIAQLKVALSIDPDCVAFHTNLGAILIRANRSSEAIREFEEALKLDPSNSGIKEELEELYKR
jgi:Flp pilus assembly protein TadD